MKNMAEKNGTKKEDWVDRHNALLKQCDEAFAVAPENVGKANMLAYGFAILAFVVPIAGKFIGFF